MLGTAEGHELDDWPYPPGESPFTVKGVALRGHVDWTREHFPGGLDAMFKLMPAEYRPFFEQNFMAASLYDLYPLCLAGRAMAPAMGKSFLEFVRHRTQWQAERDLKTFYKHLVRLVSAERIAGFMPKQIQQSFGFGEAEAHKVDAGHVHGAVRGIPAAMFPWWAAVIEVYIKRIMTLGGQDETSYVSVRPKEASASGQPLPMVDAEIDVFLHRK